MASQTLSRKHFYLSPAVLAWIGLLGILILIGLTSAVMVFWNGLYITRMSDPVPWGLWITIDLSAIALGAGAFTLSAVVYLFRLKRFQPLVRLAVFIGFIGYTTALLTLIMDIGRPDRFWHPWVYWNIHSVLWEITWCITIYLTIMLVEFAPVIAESRFFRRYAWLARLQFFIALHPCLPCLDWVSPCCTSPPWAPPTGSSNLAQSGLNPACRLCSSFQRLPSDRH
jgi:Ni/Fe-hydrogenase subunit HybB-like protein